MKILISIFIILLLTATSWATDLKQATLEQLVSERPDLVADIKAGKDERGSTVSIVKDAQGRMSIWTEETRDMKGNLISKKVDRYSYYPTGSVNEIIQEKYKGKKLISKRKIKHYRNGAQPVVKIEAVEVPMKNGVGVK